MTSVARRPHTMIRDVVLCGDKSTQPVINTGTIYQ